MQIEKDLKETLKWDIEFCNTEAEIHNGVLKLFRASANTEPRIKDEGVTRVEIYNEEQARAIHKALGELIQHLDKSRGFDRDVELVEMKSPPLNTGLPPTPMGWPIDKEEGSEL